MIKTTIFCKVTGKGVHTFYLSANGSEYYLFSQNYRRGVNAYYRNGVSLDAAMDFGKSHHDTALEKTMQKLPTYVKYIEKEYGIAVLSQTVKKNNRRGAFRAAA